MNGGGTATHSTAEHNDGSDVGKRPARDEEPGRGHAGWAAGPDLRQGQRAVTLGEPPA